ncbi:MAG: fibronectin type III domain-containing protein, partial [Verrucomicrobiales bacterium]|nr:fibronectin type III domain-containing protein [Verrucomicrobiales bacterium]
NEICEDFGNLDQMTMFVFYCFNAGATVVPFRPVGHQTNEVVLDNDDPGVTFSGSWANSTSTIFWGSAGDLPYRYASLAASETATATYTPTIPMAGFYPVYCWTRHGSDRGDQLYRIRHTGGETQVRVPHYRVGNGWVYLGTYYFNAGSNAASGAVVISNLRSTTNGSVVIADAIRVGNGMGDVDRGTGVSDYPREEEASRYWVQRMLGQGQSSSLYDVSGLDDQDDNVGTPPRTAAEMNREASGTIYQRIYIGFHSNAGGGRGAVGLYRSDANTTPHQQRLAYLCGHEVNVDMESIGAPPLEVPWDSNRASEAVAGTYGEINGASINQEMDATIIEVGFHDQADDAKILRDPKGRNWIARAVYHAVLRYMNEFDSVPLNFLPEPPVNVRALAVSQGIQVAWDAPVAQAGSGAPTGYVIYQSTNGYGFGNPVGVSGSNTLSFTFTNLLADVDYYFRVAATNAGGESLPSETVGCRRAATPGALRVLVVNAFDRFERALAPRQTPSRQNYTPPGNTGTMVRVIPRAINAFDYVVTYGRALAAAGVAFDSCQNEAVANDQIALTNYPIVLWACGNESTADETFSAAERERVTAFLAAGGNLFASGADIAWDMDRPSGPGAAKRNFLHNQLHAAYAADNAGTYTATPDPAGIFATRGNVTFDDGTRGIYWVQTPDVLTPHGPGAMPALHYSGGTGGVAAVQYDGSAGGGRVVYFGFPWETITNVTRRNNYLADILAFLNPPVAPQFLHVQLTAPNRLEMTVRGQAGVTLEVWRSADLTTWHWQTNLLNPVGRVTFADAIAPALPQRFYRLRTAP